MRNGDENFKKMCMAARWTKHIDTFVEPDINEVETDDANRNQEETRDDSGQFEEEARVERNVARFVDVDDEYDEYATGSDSEDDGNLREEYFRYIKGSGELKMKMVFDSLEAFKSAMVDYVLKTGRNVKYVRWDPDRSELKCASRCEKDKSEKERGTETEGDKGTETERDKEIEGEKENEGEKETEEDGEPCAWKIYCSYKAPLQKWMVKTYNAAHSCLTTGYSKLLTQEVIAKLFVNDVRDDPTMMPKRIQKSIQDRWHLTTTPDQCR
ncbi:uncharacterized protein LOC9324527 isoform X2 [Arabidopsis lyrata subsp. lyrata]|uniref:uncharacterized protein LOC9324527 isoform X2 n=1 Tax=Arabidopsis lyrata subsp. lyrata TaxID=81972 RepID=UPI000A29D60C|nr:uncharacterized protein LOC9324527 isoform X2 [Arabidopsis lyrata subsp. lyrata]|eukprot:XP_020891500.1 uncharacterized protein LOC9324527 isoform X2 [Arabidopsis lyrata subsp. lyrata]